MLHSIKKKPPREVSRKDRGARGPYINEASFEHHCARTIGGGAEARARDGPASARQGNRIGWGVLSRALADCIINLWKEERRGDLDGLELSASVEGGEGKGPSRRWLLSRRFHQMKKKVREEEKPSTIIHAPEFTRAQPNVAHDNLKSKVGGGTGENGVSALAGTPVASHVGNKVFLEARVTP